MHIYNKYMFNTVPVETEVLIWNKQDFECPHEGSSVKVVTYGDFLSAASSQEEVHSLREDTVLNSRASCIW